MAESRRIVVSWFSEFFDHCSWDIILYTVLLHKFYCPNLIYSRVFGVVIPPQAVLQIYRKLPSGRIIIFTVKESEPMNFVGVRIRMKGQKLNFNLPVKPNLQILLVFLPIMKTSS